MEGLPDAEQGQRGRRAEERQRKVWAMLRHPLAKMKKIPYNKSDFAHPVRWALLMYGGSMEQSIGKKFWLFALPSMLGQLLNSLFIIVDGFFIGQNLGDTGLAAINVAWPMVALIQAISMAIGTGGAVRMSIAVGRKDGKTVLRARDNAVFMLCSAAVLLGTLFYLLHPYVLPLLGANEELYPLTADYIRVVSVCAACQVFTTGIMPLLRGAGRAIASMSLTILGLVGNIFLDWLFIYYFAWGMKGVALATAMSQGVSGFLGLILLLARKDWVREERFRPRLGQMSQIARLGCSAFGLTISTSVLILLNNLQALRYGGTEGVAVYAVLSYVLGSVLPLVSGVGDGIQPLLGNAYGAGDEKTIHTLRNMGFSLAVCTALLCSLGCWLGRFYVPDIFGASPSASAEVTGALWTLILAFPFMAAVRFSCSYFCALSQPVHSSILAYCEPLVAQPVWLLLLPLIWKLEGVWMSYPAAMISMTVVALILFRTKERR